MNSGNVGASTLSGSPITYGSSPMQPTSSPLTVAVKTPNSTPTTRSPFMRAQTSPVAQICVSTGKSPLRSCHTNSDAVTHLRRLTTATFVNNSSPPNRSPTVVN